MPTDCAPCPGKTMPKFIAPSRKILELDQRRAPGEPAADAFEHDLVSGLDAPVAARKIERERHRRRRGVGVPVYGDHEALRGQPEALDGGVENSDVRLVRDKPVDVVQAHAALCDGLARDLVQHSHRESEDRGTVHLDERATDDPTAADIAGYGELADVG